MLNRFGIAIGAGLASALLFSVTAKGTALAMLLAYLAPLPIMIVALGWGLDADALACVLAAVAVGVVIDPGSGLLFFLTVALPSAALGALAIATRVNPFDRSPPAPGARRASLGALAVSAAGFATVVSAGALIVMIVMNGGYDKAVAAFRDMLEPTLAEAIGESGDLPNELGAADVARLIVKYAPAAIAASTALMLIINLYLAARVAQVSQRLARPWTDIPTTFRLPLPVAIVALLAAVGWLVLPEPYNPFVAALAAPLALMFAFQGLAVLHALSRRAPGRTALMFTLYFALLLAPRWVGLALAVIGLAESALSLRTRQTPKPFQN